MAFGDFVEKKKRIEAAHTNRDAAMMNFFSRMTLPREKDRNFSFRAALAAALWRSFFLRFFAQARYSSLSLNRPFFPLSGRMGSGFLGFDGVFGTTQSNL